LGRRSIPSGSILPQKATGGRQPPSKTLDLDGDNAYGTDGYIAGEAQTTILNPSYAMLAIVGGTQDPANGGAYINVDQPLAHGPGPIADENAPARYHFPVPNLSEHDSVEITLTAAGIFRVAVLSDIRTPGGNQFNSTGFRFRQTVGGGADSGMQTFTNDGSGGDWHVFEISGEAGDVFRLSLRASASAGETAFARLAVDGIVPVGTDTDGDCLLDGDEVNTHNTNPLLVDTDGDTFPDLFEINPGGVQRSDPNNAGSIPSAPPSGLPLVDDFDDKFLNPFYWTVNTSIPQGNASVTEQNGRVELVGRAHLNTARQFDPEVVGGIRITGQWTFAGNQDSPPAILAKPPTESSSASNRLTRSRIS